MSTERGERRAAFERMLRPSISLGGRTLSSFQVWGVSGLVVAVAIAMALAARLGLSVGLVFGLAGAAALTFYAHVLITRAVSPSLATPVRMAASTSSCARLPIVLVSAVPNAGPTATTTGSSRSTARWRRLRWTSRRTAVCGPVTS